VGRRVLPKSSVSRCVGGRAEQLVEAGMGGIHLGEQAPSSAGARRWTGRSSPSPGSDPALTTAPARSSACRRCEVHSASLRATWVAAGLSRKRSENGNAMMPQYWRCRRNRRYFHVELSEIWLLALCVSAVAAGGRASRSGDHLCMPCCSRCRSSWLTPVGGGQPAAPHQHEGPKRARWRVAFHLVLEVQLAVEEAQCQGTAGIPCGRTGLLDAEASVGRAPA
jgi:hypothetical protein